jgi:hypothetical protein
MGRGEMCTKYWLGSVNRRSLSKDLGVDIRIISELILGNIFGDADWIHISQIQDCWLVLANTVMNFRAP